MKKDSKQKTNARSPKSTKDRNRRLLAAASRAIPTKDRMDFDAKTLARLNRNVTAALVLQDHDGQKIACVEEMSELAQLLCRDVNGKEAPAEKIHEEIADVYITLAQMARFYFKSKEAFNAAVNRKMNKQDAKLNAIRSVLLP